MVHGADPVREGGHELHISFAVEKPRSPISLGLSGDTRSLGLGFFKLSISESS